MDTAMITTMMKEEFESAHSGRALLDNEIDNNPRLDCHRLAEELIYNDKHEMLSEVALLPRIHQDGNMERWEEVLMAYLDYSSSLVLSPGTSKITRC